MDTLNNGAGDWAYGIAVDTLDNIIVTGASDMGGNGEYFTVKYGPEPGIAEDAKDNACSMTFSVHPNPFHKKLNIYFQTPNPKSLTSIGIYDVSGCLVKSLRLLPDALRTTQITWDGRDARGQQLPSGVYFVQVETDEHRKTKKVLFIK